MEEMHFNFPATRRGSGRSHVGVVSSGDLEILFEAATRDEVNVRVRTSVSGYSAIWQATVERFCVRSGFAANIEINDFGATPGMVLLRLQQALDLVEGVSNA